MTFGNTSIEIGLIAIVLAILALKLLSLIVCIWFVVQGFKVHWGWGVANLVIPGAIIPFSIFHPKEAKKPLILLGVCLGIFLVLSLSGRHENHARPEVELTQNLSASDANAVLHLHLASSNGHITRWGSLGQKRPVMPGDHDDGHYLEERLIAIGADGFLVRFAGESQTNFVLFPYDQTIETNTAGWNIVGNYSDQTSWPHPTLEPTGDSSNINR